MIKNKFIKNASVLVSSTAISQGLAIISLPILTRIYTPHDFSILAVYISIVTIISVASGLCLEYAIPLPKSERIAAALFLLSVISVFLFSLILCFIIIFLYDLILSFERNIIGDYVFLLPVGLLFLGLYNVFQYWFNRKKSFNLIAKTRIYQSFLGNLLKINFGYFISLSSAGLLFGQLITQSAGVFVYGYFILKNDLNNFRKIKIKILKLAFLKYRKFPQFTTIELLASSVNTQFPLILVASLSSNSEAGYLMIALQFISAPISLIGGAISQVYFSEAPQKYRNNELKDFTQKIMTKLMLLSIIPFLLIAIFSPILLPFFLGENWHRSGYLISCLVPCFLMQFITSPVSTCLYVLNRQKTAFLLQFYGLFIRIGFVVYAGIYFEKYIGEAYAIAGFLFYLLYAIVVLRVLSKLAKK